jgi:hypothetical protein
VFTFFMVIVRSKTIIGVSKSMLNLGLFSLVVLTGCSTVKVHLGLRLSLAKTTVTSMEASQFKHPGIGPGEKSSLIVEFTQPDGTVLVTEGKGKGKILWSDLSVTATVVSVNKKGVLSLSADPRVSDGKTAHITVTVPSHPGMNANLDVPLRYNYKFVANYSGASGSNGSDGNNGSDGSSGTMGSLDPNNPSAGGNGGDGTNGTNGSDGEPGGDAPSVQVQVTLRPGAHPLLQVGVTAKGRKEHFYLVDPQGGSLTIMDEGGAGGSGGKGGRGGSGGSGGIGSPSGSSGNSGSNGSDGSNGSPGRSGNITVTYDPQVKPYLAAILTSNQGAPKPVFTEAPVPPLW